MYVAELPSAHFRLMTIDRADVPNRAGLVTSSVQAQVDGTSNDRSEGFGRLPNGEIKPSVTGRRVSNNDGSFPEKSVIIAGGRGSLLGMLCGEIHSRSPEESGGDTAKRTSEEHEPGSGSFIVCVQSGAVERVSDGLSSAIIPPNIS